MKKDWEVKRLGEISNIIYGYTEKSSYKNIGPKFLRITDIQDNNVDWNTVPHCRIDEESFDKYKLFDGDIVFARTGATTGKSYLVKNPPKSVFASYLIRVSLTNKILLSDYLILFFHTKHFWDEIKAGISGSAQGGFNAKKLKEFEVPIPPLKEQKRIVKILEKSFAAIDKAKANAEQNLKNAKELFESYLNEVFENKGDDWEEKTLEEIAELEYGYTYKSSHRGDLRYIRITDIDKNGKLILEDKKYIKHSAEAKKFLLQNNDLLMARTGATFAKVLLYKDYEPSVFASYLIKIMFNVNIENELYWYFTKTKNYWGQAKSLSSGSAQPHFNGKALRKVLFSYPKLVNKQKKLIADFRSLAIEIQTLKNIYMKKIEELEELKKSILQKAFMGRL